MTQTQNSHADDDAIPLAEMIETLRGELQKSQEQGAGQAIAFQIDKVELQLKVAISRKVKGQGASRSGWSRPVPARKVQRTSPTISSSR